MKIEPNNIYCGDCYELIKEIPDKSIDMCYIDPPYSYDKSFGNRLVEQGKISQDTNNHIKQMSGGIKKSLLDDIIKKLRYIYISLYGATTNKYGTICNTLLENIIATIRFLVIEKQTHFLLIKRDSLMT